jgi:hypothetical protein
MKEKQKNDTKYLEELIVYNNALYSVLFCPRKFQRSFRKFFKFSIPHESVIYLRPKVSKKGIKIRIQPDNYFLITRNSDTKEYFFHATTHKELVSKLIFHDLI